ncbi:Ig-like domain-containing protein, partial [Thiomicrospira microaerophila]|uniref:Ig-like domain-containing protein n=1 Tax=Thiomicrospira microaerophila TaxID=406020 RepID=UPI0005CB14A3
EGVDVSGLTDGELTIDAVATDNNGNTVTAQDTADLDAVDGNLTVTAEDSTDGNLNISGTSQDVPENGEVTITITSENGGTPVVVTTTVDADGNYSLTDVDVSGLTDGVLSVLASAEDHNGNAVTDTATAELDNLAGAITVELADVNGGNDTAVPISGTTTDVPAGATVNLVIEDQNGATVTTSAVVQGDGTYLVTADLSGLVDGPLTVTASATDHNGDPVDTTDGGHKSTVPPTLTISSDDASLAAGGSTEITFSFSEDVLGFDETDVSVDGGMLSNFTQVDGSTWTADFEASGSSPIDISVADATYTDLVGNPGSGDGHAINNLPTSADDTLAADDSENIVYDASALFTDVDGDNLTFSISGQPASLAINTNTGMITGTLDSSDSQGGAAGTYTITITADDGNGGLATAELELTVSNPAPIAVDDSGTTDEKSLLTVAADGVLANDSDPDGDPLTVSAVEGVAGNVGTPVAGDNGGEFT